MSKQLSKSEGLGKQRRLQPPVDIFENADEILLMVDLPGVPQDAVDIRIDRGELTLVGRQPAQNGEGELGLEPVAFERAFEVPNTIDAETIGAELANGVLRVRLRKSEKHKPRRIDVRKA